VNKRLSSLYLLCLTLLLCAGCSSTSPPVSYHSLVDTNPLPMATAANEQLTISVGPVAIPDLLKKSQIATNDPDGRFKLSSYNRWTGEVDREFARAVAEQLAVRLGTQRVVIYPWEQTLDPTRRVLIDILAMGGELGKQANLTVRWALLDPQGKVPTLVRRSDLSEVPAGANYQSWVAAQKRNIATLSQEIAAALQP